MQKVLIIEDDIKMQRLYQRAFTFAGYEVKICSNGAEGLAQVIDYNPQIILLDIMMPEMNGMDTLSELKKKPLTKDIPVIMLTNIVSGTLESAKQAVKNGAVEYIIKSDHEPTEVVDRAKKIIDQHMTLAH